MHCRWYAMNKNHNKRKDRKYDNNMKKAGRVQERTQKKDMSGIKIRNPGVEVKSDRGNNLGGQFCHSKFLKNIYT